MRITAALILAGAFIATPSLAQTTYTTSWEGTMTEMQKKGPYATVRGPDRAGGYYVSGTGRQPRPLWSYRWKSPFHW
jgi:hypothetical protein